MFRILIIDKELQTKEILKKSLGCLKSKIDIVRVSSYVKAYSFLGTLDIDFFVLSIYNNFEEVMKFTSELHKIRKYSFSPLTFVASKIDYIIWACRDSNCFDFVIKPLNDNSFQKTSMLISLILIPKHNGIVSGRRFLSFKKTDIMVRVPLDEIIFIEARERKSMIYTYVDEFSVTEPLKNILQSAKDTPLIQSHRSYIVNVENIRKIDKTTEPWTIFFFGSQRKSYAGKSYRTAIAEEFESRF